MASKGLFTWLLSLVDKEGMRKKREDVVKAVQEKLEQEQIERATKKREAEKVAIKQQMQVRKTMT